MDLPESNFQILRLTDDFYNAYPNPPYVETILKLKRIKREALTFVEDYVSHIKGEKVLHSKEFERRYHYLYIKIFSQGIRCQRRFYGI